MWLQQLRDSFCHLQNKYTAKELKYTAKELVMVSVKLDETNIQVIHDLIVTVTVKETFISLISLAKDQKNGYMKTDSNWV